MTTVVNIHHGAEYDIYIGRPGRGQPGSLGDPIAIGRTCLVCGAKHGRDAELLKCYKRCLWRRIRRDREFAKLVMSCHGKRLGCFCVRPDGSGLCHGHVLAKAAQWLHDGGYVKLWPDSPEQQALPGPG